MYADTQWYCVFLRSSELCKYNFYDNPYEKYFSISRNPNTNINKKLLRIVVHIISLGSWSLQLSTMFDILQNIWGYLLGFLNCIQSLCIYINDLPNFKGASTCEGILPTAKRQNVIVRQNQGLDLLSVLWPYWKFMCKMRNELEIDYAESHSIMRKSLLENKIIIKKYWHYDMNWNDNSSTLFIYLKNSLGLYFLIFSSLNRITLNDIKS